MPPPPGSTDAPSTPRLWAAPLAPAPVTATVELPGSKSETNRALVLAALASGPSTVSNGLEARDTLLMRAALHALGVLIEESREGWRITPPPRFTGAHRIDCGLAGTVLRFVPALAVLADGPVTFVGDDQARGRPMGPLLGALSALGVGVDSDRLPFTVTGSSRHRGGAVSLDASGSSQFVSSLLMIGARLAGGLEIRHVGPTMPSLPHVAMTVAMLRERGVQVDDTEPDRWAVTAGEIAAADVTVQPDLSNAAPFLAAAAATGGRVSIPGWPHFTAQPGDALRDILARFGAEVELTEDRLIVTGTDRLWGVDLDLGGASELTPVVAALAALAGDPSRLAGVAHIRGHETDRLAALETELQAMGAHVRQTSDGLSIHPKLMGGQTFHTYADHRMAQAGAVLGLVIPDVVLDDVGCTDKTMPGFVDAWTAMLADTEAAAQAQQDREEAADVELARDDVDRVGDR